ncbi:histone-like nucleoid-structuring protein Lsr2 [Embleya hyalina]|uniref:Lsr2 family protein n=1 Tax=Embleya hyalina TaxID=516124 RepID=A0A401YQP5_9ACTN|nr:Lsr2 family protein [Embleya hyalina]GCD96944.1 Lsr2 family protein [Embleya hyalina]
MARRVVTLYIDDITGGEGADVVTHTFSLDGIGYEIDLGIDSFQGLLDVLGPYFGAARRIGTNTNRRRNAGKGQAAVLRPSPARVRAWASTHGIEVNTRGRLSTEVLARYEATHSL